MWFPEKTTINKSCHLKVESYKFLSNLHILYLNTQHYTNVGKIFEFWAIIWIFFLILRFEKR